MLVFQAENPDWKAPAELQQFAQAAREVLRNTSGDPLAPEAITRYFRQLYWQKGDLELDKKNLLAQIESKRLEGIPFELLARELRSNVSLRIELTDSPDAFKVSGRGELHLAILIETMRREGYELQVSRPEVIYRRIADVLSEPIEHVIIDVPDDFVGAVIENLGRRRGEMRNMITSSGNTRLEFLVPSRGLIGFRGEFMTQTKGTGILHHNFHGYEPYKGEMAHRTRGALVAMESGEAVAYGMWKLQERSVFFIEPGTQVYAGMVVGENSREQDMNVNVCKTKQLTNMRASGSDEAIRLTTPREMGLEQCIEFINDDELVEVTPATIRLRKRVLASNMRPKRQD